MKKMKCTCEGVEHIQDETTARFIRKVGTEDINKATRHIKVSGNCTCEWNGEEKKLDQVHLDIVSSGADDIYSKRFQHFAEGYRGKLHPVVSIPMVRNDFFW